MCHYFLVASWRNGSLFPDSLLQECVTISWWPPETMYHYFLMASWRYVSLFPEGLLKECITIFQRPPKGMCHYFLIANWMNVAPCVPFIQQWAGCGPRHWKMCAVADWTDLVLTTPHLLYSPLSTLLQGLTRFYATQTGCRWLISYIEQKTFLACGPEFSVEFSAQPEFSGGVTEKYLSTGWARTFDFQIRK